MEQLTQFLELGHESLTYSINSPKMSLIIFFYSRLQRMVAKRNVCDNEAVIKKVTIQESDFDRSSCMEATYEYMVY